MFGAMAVRKIADARGDANPVCLSGPDGMTGPYGGSGPAFMAVRIAGRTPGAKARVRIRSSETGRPVRAVSDGPLQQSEHPAGRRVCLVLPAE